VYLFPVEDIAMSPSLSSILSSVPQVPNFPPPPTDEENLVKLHPLFLGHATLLILVYLLLTQQRAFKPEICHYFKVNLLL